MSAMQYTPRGNNVLFEQLEAQSRSKGGVMLPDRAKENPLLAKVIAVGPGKEVPIGNRAHEEMAEYQHENLPPTVRRYDRFEPIFGVAVGDVIFFNIRHAIPCDKDPSCRLGMVDADHILATVKVLEPERN